MNVSRPSRRRFLAGLGTAGSFSVGGDVASKAGTTATLQVRVYPGPTPSSVRTAYGWSRVHLEASFAVYRALWSLARYAEDHGAVDQVGVSVEPMAPITSDPGRESQGVVLDAFHDEIHDRGSTAADCCHLLLWWDPWNHELGYGGVRWPNNHVGKEDDEGSQTVANVGATEAWDSRAVTNNMAIHEVLHTFLSTDVVREVTETGCDHDLGSAVRTDRETLRISPIATAYAGPDRVGGGTRFHGTGCYDHESFYRHDGYDDVSGFEYTAELSEGVLEAGTRYIERYLTR